MTDHNRPRRINGFIRVSTNRQDVQRQRTELLELRSIYGITLIRTLELQDVSGRHVLDDSDVEKILVELENPEIDGIGISALDRLFRPDSFKTMEILDRFKNSGKLIFSRKEGIIDLNTDTGNMMAFMAAAQASMEWRELRRRTMNGKEAIRLAGGHPMPLSNLPRGVIFSRFSRQQREQGKPNGIWKYDPIVRERMKKAYGLILADRLSIEDIHRLVGGFALSQHLRRSLKNPIWKAVRLYAWEAKGPEFKPKSTDPSKKVKARRKMTLKAEPLEVKLDFEGGPVVSEEEWQRAQDILAERSIKWRKSRISPEGRQRFLGNGLLRCVCGASVYVQYCRSGHGRDHYHCSTYFPRSKKRKETIQPCGRFWGFNTRGKRSKVIFRDDLDPALVRLMTDYLAKADRYILEQPLDSETATDASKAIEAKLADIAQRRKATIELAGIITKQEIKNRIADLDREIAELKALRSPASKQSPDAKLIAMNIARLFAEFAFLQQEKQQEMLRRLCKEITVDGMSIPSVTLRGSAVAELMTMAISPRPRAAKPRKAAVHQPSGAFLEITPNSDPRSTAQGQIGCFPDLVVKFPVPLQIERVAA